MSELPDPADVQATLTMLTATSIVNAIRDHAPGIRQAYVCGGGAKNGFLMALLKQMLENGDIHAELSTSHALGIDPMACRITGIRMAGLPVRGKRTRKSACRYRSARIPYSRCTVSGMKKNAERQLPTGP